MKFSFEGRWTINELKAALCESLDTLAADEVEPWTGVFWISGANFYFTPENMAKNSIALELNARGVRVCDEFLFHNPKKGAPQALRLRKTPRTEEK